jgi:hypothetical protein
VTAKKARSIPITFRLRRIAAESWRPRSMARFGFGISREWGCGFWDRGDVIGALITAASLVLPQVPGVYQGPGCTGHPARPPSSYTTALKIQQIHDLGYTDTNPSHYEEDHLVQLSLGGDSRDPMNLWPQPWVQAHRDDRIETDLWRRACLRQGRPLLAAEAVRWERVWKHRRG